MPLTLATHSVYCKNDGADNYEILACIGENTAKELCDYLNAAPASLQMRLGAVYPGKKAFKVCKLKRTHHFTSTAQVWKLLELLNKRNPFNLTLDQFKVLVKKHL